ncbi:MAG: DUF3795 domain-containing protein [Candidatus Bathyarchaeota archaeon]|nr:DUF3795 domain-containing protein [Candidatus Bathyarchaeota archaeon]
MLGEKQMVAVCGLNCAKCEIFQASSNRDLAQKIVDWFKKERDTVVKVEDICCLGCRGDRAKHWSPDCWILKCCVDEKGLEYCFQCGDFPCEKLKEWAEENKSYGEALNRLVEMRKK